MSGAAIVGGCKRIVDALPSPLGLFAVGAAAAVDPGVIRELAAEQGFDLFKKRLNQWVRDKKTWASVEDALEEWADNDGIDRESLQTGSDLAGIVLAKYGASISEAWKYRLRSQTLASLVMGRPEVCTYLFGHTEKTIATCDRAVSIFYDLFCARLQQIPPGGEPFLQILEGQHQLRAKVDEALAQLTLTGETVKSLAGATNDRLDRVIQLLDDAPATASDEALARFKILHARAMVDAGTVRDPIYSPAGWDDQLATDDFSRGLYVRRDIETELLTSLTTEPPLSPVIVHGDPGAGKTSLIWGIATELATKCHRQPLFVKASWLTADAGAEAVAAGSGLRSAIEASATGGLPATLLIDTADLLVRDEAALLTLSSVVRDAISLGAGVLVTSRPAESNLLPNNWTRIHLGPYSTAPRVAGEASEFERAVATHSKHFCVNPQSARDVAQRLTIAVARRWPVGSLCLKPLTLRMLFEIYQPAVVPQTLDVTDLYARYWADRVVRDRRDWSGTVTGSGIATCDTSSTARLIALEMLQRGLPEVALRTLPLPADLARDRVTSDIELLRRRGVGRIEGGVFRFFHQTFFEFTAAKALLDRAPERALWALIDRCLTHPDDYFLIAILEQTWQCAWRNPETRMTALQAARCMLDRILGPANRAIPYSLKTAVIAVVTQSPVAPADIYEQLGKVLDVAELPTVRDCLALLPPPGRPVGATEVTLLAAAASRNDAAWVSALEALSRVAEQDPALALSALAPMKIEDRIRKLSGGDAVAKQLPEVLVQLLDTNSQVVLPIFTSLIARSREVGDSGALARMVALISATRRPPAAALEWADAEAADSPGPQALVQALTDLHHAEALESGIMHGWDPVLEQLSAALARAESDTGKFSASAKATIAGTLMALGDRATTCQSQPVAELLDGISNPSAHALLTKGCLTQLLSPNGCTISPMAVRWLAEGLPADHARLEGVRQRRANAIRGALEREDVPVESAAAIAVGAAEILVTQGTQETEIWLDPDRLLRLLIRFTAADVEAARKAFGVLLDPLHELSPAAKRTVLQKIQTASDDLEAGLALDFLIRRREVRALVYYLESHGPQTNPSVFKERRNQLDALVQWAVSSSSGDVRLCGLRVWRVLSAQNLLPFPDLEQWRSHYQTRNLTIRGVLAKMAGTAVTKGVYPLDFLREELMATLGTGAAELNGYDALAAREALVTGFATAGSFVDVGEMLQLAFLRPVDAGVVARIGSYLNPRHRLADGPSLDEKLEVLIKLGELLADTSISRRVGRDVSSGWAPLLSEIMSATSPAQQIALVDSFPKMNQDMTANLALMLQPSRDGELRRRMSKLIEGDQIGERTRQKLQESLRQLVGISSQTSWWDLDKDLAY